MTDLILIFISASLVNNFVLARFLGICPYFGVSKSIDTSLGMSLAVIFVMTIAGIITWIINYTILIPLDLTYLRIIIFILVIATLVQFVEMAIRKVSPVLYNALGIYLPLITTNCAILGAVLLNIQNEYSFLEMLVFTLGSSTGFGFALVIFAGIRERVNYSDVPLHFRGAPIAFIIAGILSLAFMGFSGLVR